MPRIAGQIDRTKNEAILDAASEVLYERGLSAPMEEIARRAGVSKQTIYNHYGSKAELVKALIERRVELVAAPLDEPSAKAHPEAALAAYASAILANATSERAAVVLRLVIESAPGAPELAAAAFGAAVRESRARLAAFLQREARAGELVIDDPAQAADFFSGMVLGSHQMQRLFGLAPTLDATDVERIAASAARRFVRAYRP